LVFLVATIYTINKFPKCRMVSYRYIQPKSVDMNKVIRESS